MECRGLVADFDAATGQLTVHSANQGVALAKMILAGQLGHDPDKLRILCGDIGGSFGLKLGAAREDIAVAAASRALERPVKWIEDRGEHLVASGHAREETMQAALAYSADGDLLGIDVDMTMDTGAYPGMGGMICGLVERMLPGPYKIGAVRFRSTSDGHQQGRVRRLSRTVGRRGVHAGADDRHRGQATRSRAARHPAAERRHPRRGAAADGDGAEPRRRHDAGVARTHRRARRPPGVQEAAGGGAGGRSLPRHRLRQLHRGGPGAERGRRRRRDGEREHAHAPRRRRHRPGVHRPDAARAEPRDDVRPDRGRRARCAVRAGAGRRRRQRHQPVRDDRWEPGGDDGRRRHAAHRSRAEGADPRRVVTSCSRRVPATS